MKGNKYPSPDEGRDPVFVKLDNKLDSPRTRRFIAGCVYASMYGMALFILACLCDFAGAGEWIYKYGGSW